MKRGILINIHKRKLFKVVAMFMAVNIIAEIISPTAAWALTSGPAQEEYASFEPVETTNMVDPYTGDFTYNLPLLSVPGPNGGYPINLAYHAGPGVDEEASWVGLGWNINMGAINRQLKGLPDDVNGDNVVQQVHMKKNIGFSVNIPSNATRERYGFPTSQDEGFTSALSTQAYWNNYRGIGYRVNIGLSKRLLSFNSILSGIGGLNLSFDSQNGLGVEPNLSLGAFMGKNEKGVGLGFGAQVGINSRTGLQSMGFSTGLVCGREKGDARKATRRDKKLGRAENGLKKDINCNSMYSYNDMSMSSALSFATNPSIPPVSLAMKNTVNSFYGKFSNNVSVGVTDYKVIFDKWKHWQGSYDESELADGGNFTNPGYGYLYTHNGNGNTAIKDFSRENIPYSKNIPNLAPSSFNYDVYSISGQGTGGMFRPYRNDIGILTDPTRTSTTTIYDHTEEFGVQSTLTSASFHVGLGVNIGNGIQESGKWQNNTTLGSHLQFRSGVANYPEYEPYYFQMYGEKTAAYASQNFLDDTLSNHGWHNDTPLRVKLAKTGSGSSTQYDATSEFINETGGSTLYDASTGNKNFKTTRTKRATNIESLTNEQAKNYGMSRGLEYLNTSGTKVSKFSSSERYSNSAYAKHISEISVHQPDGMKYTYGLPVYNTEHEDAAFRIKYNSTTSPVYTSEGSAGEQFVSLVTGWNNGTSINHENGGTMGLDEYVSQTYKPAYVHTWLLTTVVSSDYVDSDNTPGPSDGDLGYWVKMNYANKVKDYQWRIPFHDATYIQGSLSDDKDNMATYSYGKKDLFYVTSVETKTHIAVFELSARKDGYEANGHFASSSSPRGSSQTYRLDKIKLYAKNDYYLSNGSVNPNAVPIKTVNFAYDYSLCKGSTSITGSANIPTNSGASEGSPNVNYGGKLTLKKVWFTYNSSTRGALSPYQFVYGSNPDYVTKLVDRWGNVRIPGESSTYPYIKFPYTPQSTAPDASAWNLTQVIMPSGGKLNIEYEPDDYSYVEDQHATQMYDIAGLGNSNGTSNFDTGRDNATTSIGYTRGRGIPANGCPSGDEHIFGDAGNFRVYFHLSETLPSGWTSTQYSTYILDHYVRGLSKVYFRAKINLSDLATPTFDDVAGYADIVTTGTGDFCGATTDVNGDYTVGYITLKKEPLNKRNVFGIEIHPFQAAAFAHLRLNRTDVVYGGSSSVANWQSLVSFMPDIISSAVSFNRYCYNTKYSGETVELNGRSIIRLCSPVKKYGGGVRVKKLYVEESNFSTSAGTNKYGLTYDYTMDEQMPDGTTATISSGVAYEPQVGGEESALRQPIEYTESHLFKAAQDLFLEKPLLESYYPGPGVGYRKVTITSMAYQDAATNINSSSLTVPSLCNVAPATVYEFYTPKDFPVYGDETDMSADPAIVKIGFIPGITARFRKSMARSQGYSIVLNDMAGKLKSLTALVPGNKTTGTKDKILSRDEYIYDTQGNYDPNKVNKLNNYVKVLGSEGQCAYATVGQSSDIFMDMNENFSNNLTQGLDFNIGVHVYPPSPATPPLIIPIPLPTENELETSLKTVVTTKVIYKTGILKQEKHYDGQAITVTDYLAYDAETGNPLYTKVTNEFEDEIFSLSFPGHWYYGGMQGAYQNYGVALTGISVAPNGTTNNGRYDLAATGYSASRYFTQGDELWVVNSVGTGSMAYVLEVNQQNPNNFIRCIDANGAYLTSTLTSIRVVRSGHRNMQTTNIGSILTNVDYGCGSLAYGTDPKVMYGVLKTSAMVYSDDWKLNCGQTGVCGTVVDDLVNPFLKGLKGVWRPSQQYVYIDERQQYDNIREDGVFKNAFYLFSWKNPSLVLNATNRWKLANTITKYSPAGFELENLDALGNYSAALYGYKNSLVTAVGANTSYNDMLYDGFEDYYVVSSASTKPCNESHWFPDLTSNAISPTQAHTGQGSYKVTTATRTTSISLTAPPSCTTGNQSYKEITGAGTKLDGCGCNGVFRPAPGKQYVLSAWTKQVAPTATVGSSPVNYTAPEVTITFYDNTSTIISASTVFIIPQSSEKIIEGWQRLYKAFTVPATAARMDISFQNNLTGYSVYYDDLRIHPFDANIKSFVYNPTTLKPVAELDANNYATYFIYDEEGALSKTKKETVEGIKTISEGRSGLKH